MTVISDLGSVLKDLFWSFLDVMPSPNGPTFGTMLRLYDYRLASALTGEFLKHFTTKISVVDGSSLNCHQSEARTRQVIFCRLNVFSAWQRGVQQDVWRCGFSDFASVVGIFSKNKPLKFPWFQIKSADGCYLLLSPVGLHTLCLFLLLFSEQDKLVAHNKTCVWFCWGKHFFARWLFLCAYHRGVQQDASSVVQFLQKKGVVPMISDKTCRWLLFVAVSCGPPHSVYILAAVFGLNSKRLGAVVTARLIQTRRNARSTNDTSRSEVSLGIMMIG